MAPRSAPVPGVPRPGSLVPLAVLVAVGGGVPRPASGLQTADPDESRRTVERTGPGLAVAWAEVAYDVAWAEDQLLTFKGQRAMAMMHLAMHDALQAVVPVYAPYAWEGHDPGADPSAAASAAAYEVLLDAYPDRGATLDSVRMRWSGGPPGSSSAAAGEELGIAAARAILRRRRDDGWDRREGSYVFRAEPGQYRTTPPWDGFTLLPGFRFVTPFSFDDPARFRPPPPPALDSPEYVEALNEVRVQGDSTSAARTGDQTAYAVWWMEFAEASVGRLARRLLLERGTDLWRANRMLAHMYVALFDGYVANWDSKYEYNHWRPYTAIRAADGREATSPVSDWVPLRPTPPFPEYASAHATGCAAAFEVLAGTFGDDTPFELSTRTAPRGAETRRFAGFRASADECADSRIRLGWHFRYATDEGLRMGRGVARHVMDSLLLPR